MIAQLWGRPALNLVHPGNLYSMMRIRVTFAKTDAMRFTGHLDLQRALERTLRRAQLPVLYTQGYNPRMRLNLGSALPLGYTSQGELIEIWLDNGLTVPQIEAALSGAVPPGVEILQVEQVATELPKLPNLICSAEYQARILLRIPDLDKRLTEILSAEQLMRQRRGKRYDLRPLIEKLYPLPNNQDDLPALFMRMTNLPGATGRPEEVLLELGVPIQDARIQRIRLILRNL